MCAAWYSPWTVSLYFLVFLFMISIVLVNILLSFFLDIYAFVWQEYTKRSATAHVFTPSPAASPPAASPLQYHHCSITTAH